MASMRIGIVLMNLGGPTHEDNVKIFLKNLFSDEDIIKLGGGVAQKTFARVISKLNTPPG
jgi:protoporphyrin/coproporphyrin ferrochelatase